MQAARYARDLFTRPTATLNTLLRSGRGTGDAVALTSRLRAFELPNLLQSSILTFSADGVSTHTLPPACLCAA
jgi:hypothetical protein